MEGEFAKKCIEYSEKKSYGIISEKVLLKKCFCMPKEGVTIRFPNGRKYIHYGVKPIFNSISISQLGHYYIRNNICAFVYRDGTTYVTCSKEVIRIIKKAGYKPGSVWVPFSDPKETILNPQYQEEWERIKKIIS